MKRILFLLGGHDLEMVIIKELLIKKGFSEADESNYKDIDKAFVDKNLKWDNATLSQYKRFMDFEGEIYGIELRDNSIDMLDNYTLIDHHNEKNELPSPLEQVAGILGVKLDRYHQLVAANDKGYIPAMEETGATVEEIADIRRKDRACQGVTREDEKLGERSISINLSKYADVTVVKSLTDKFSTITDHLYPCRKLIIYTDSELNYYGKNSRQLAGYFTNLVAENKAYFGGSDDGYFGLAGGRFTKDEIIEFKNKIINYARTL